VLDVQPIRTLLSLLLWWILDIKWKNDSKYNCKHEKSAADGIEMFFYLVRLNFLKLCLSLLIQNILFFESVHRRDHLFERATHSFYHQSRLLSIIQTGTSVLGQNHEFTSLAIIRLETMMTKNDKFGQYTILWLFSIDYNNIFIVL